MPSRIDELFSPQRLRRTWNRRIREPLWQWNQSAGARTDVDGEGAASRRGADEEQWAGSEAPPAGPQGIGPEFDRLKRLIRQRFPGRQGEALDIMLEDLHKLLTRRFPQAGKAAVAKEAAASEDKTSEEGDMTAIDQSIEEVLNQIEDLVEALEL